MPALAVATFDSLFVTATDVAFAAGDEITGINSLDVSEERTTVSTLYLGDAVETFIPAHRSVAISFSGHLQNGSAPLTTLRTSFLTPSVCWLHVITFPTAGVGIVKGQKFPVYISTMSTKMATGDVVAIDFAAVLAAPPSNILGT